MRLDLLPHRLDGAAANMASDFLLLQAYPEPDHARFRAYGWHRPAFTFGFSQKLDWVRTQLPPESDAELCRRPTGGGVVDHSNDWTYALVIPRGHPVCDLRAVESYRGVHACLADALRERGVPAVLKESCGPDPDACPPGPGVCFQRAEFHDVVREPGGEKIAGAAQKRSKRGLLFQGSVWRPAAGDIDWDAFGAAFTENLARFLGAAAESSPWPDYHGLDDDLREQYASPEWTHLR